MTAGAPIGSVAPLAANLGLPPAVVPALEPQTVRAPPLVGLQGATGGILAAVLTEHARDLWPGAAAG